MKKKEEKKEYSLVETKYKPSKAKYGNDYLEKTKINNFNFEQIMFVKYCRCLLQDRFIDYIKEKENNKELSNIQITKEQLEELADNMYLRRYIINLDDFLDDLYDGNKKKINEKKRRRERKKNGIVIKVDNSIIDDIDFISNLTAYKKKKDGNLLRFHLLNECETSKDEKTAKIEIGAEIIRDSLKTFLVDEKHPDKLKGDFTFLEYETSKKIDNAYGQKLYDYIKKYQFEAVKYNNDSKKKIKISKKELYDTLLSTQINKKTGKEEYIDKYANNKTNFEKKVLKVAIKSVEKGDIKFDYYSEEKKEQFYYDKKEEIYYFTLDFSECDYFKSITAKENIKNKEDYLKNNINDYKKRHRKIKKSITKREYDRNNDFYINKPNYDISWNLYVDEFLSVIKTPEEINPDNVILFKMAEYNQLDKETRVKIYNLLDKFKKVSNDIKCYDIKPEKDTFYVEVDDKKIYLEDIEKND